MEIYELEEHCERQLDRLPKTSKGYEEHLLTLAIIKTNRQYFNELNKKDKQIDLMARAIDNYDSQLEINTFRDKEHVKQYFKEIAERKSEKWKKI